MAQSKPWALSPLISTMPHFAHKRLSANAQIPAFSPTEESVKDSTDALHFAVTVAEGDTQSASSSAAPSPASSIVSFYSTSSGMNNFFEW